jgi:hypothetical protein
MGKNTDLLTKPKRYLFVSLSSCCLSIRLQFIGAEAWNMHVPVAFYKKGITPMQFKLK